MSDDSDDSTSQSAYTTSADESEESDVSITLSGFYFHGLYFPLRHEECARWMQDIHKKGILTRRNKAMKLMRSWIDLKSLRSLLAFRNILRTRFNADIARQIVECLLPDFMISRASERAECETRAVT